MANTVNERLANLRRKIASNQVDAAHYLADASKWIALNADYLLDFEGELEVWLHPYYYTVERIKKLKLQVEALEEFETEESADR